MNALQETRSHSSVVRRALTTAMLSCFALAGWFWSQESSPKHHQATAATISKSAMTSHPAIASPPSDSATASINLITPLTPEPPPQYATRNIEEIVLGQRLVGRNPLRHETSAPSDIDPANWRAIRLTMLQAGVFYELAFLRSFEWLDQADAKVGQHIDLVLPEMGLLGPALVESIEPCPAIEPDDGTGRMIVTGTMRHLATNVIELTITGLAEPLGVTTTHPIWSEDRQAFIPAGQLQEGEYLRQANGTLTQATHIIPKRGPPEVVYNLEVDSEHVYHVSKNAFLVHNNCLNNAASGAAAPFAGVIGACTPCADAVKKAVGDAGDRVRIQARQGDFIAVDDLAESITQNGSHEGVLVNGLIHDNLNPNGVLPLNWINGMFARGGFEVVSP